MISTISTTSSLVDPSYVSSSATDETETTDTLVDTILDAAAEAAAEADTAAATAAVETVEETSSTNNRTHNGDHDSISLSSRSQKLNAIANEFFNGGEVDFDQLTNRIYEYGLVSETEYQALGGGQSDDESDTSITDSVAQYIGDLSSNLEQLDEDQTFNGITLIELQNALTESKELLTNIGSTEIDSSVSQQATDNQLILSQVYDSSEFGLMSEDDQVVMASVIKTLSVIGTLNSGQSTNSSVSAYTSVAQY